ncbi:hypothetical protein [Noviherbaspirillum massiliense]|uniref:hypothetical protein n=1 Tax=Noviherbaspirillum massiliense TaxID=1465823 RepID=UPI00031374DB|nr:hypothetical protein [Noviherbaspirillum massiliense]
MRSEYNPRFNPELHEMNEKLRKDLMRSLESYGAKTIGDLPGMSEGERCKWFFWNLHENLDEFRKLEPTLIGQITRTQLCIEDGQLTSNQRVEVAKSLSLSCKWHVRLVYSAYQNEDAYSIGEGAAELLISDTAPTELALCKNQKAYFDSDSSLYPNQLFLHGWVTEAVWEAIRGHLYNPTPNCHTDLYLRDNSMFPVKPGFDFVAGPPGSIGITNLEFRISSHSADRRTTRRAEPLLQR